MSIIKQTGDFYNTKLDFGVYSDVGMTDLLFDPFPKPDPGIGSGIEVTGEQVTEYSYKKVYVEAETDDTQFTLEPITGSKLIIVFASFVENDYPAQPDFKIRFGTVDDQQFSVREFLYMGFYENVPSSIFISNPSIKKMQFKIILIAGD